MTLTEKEKLLLKDLKSEEQLCVDKYTKYESEATSKDLKRLFHEIMQTEMEHLQSIVQISEGNVPKMAAKKPEKDNKNAASNYDPSDKLLDTYLCKDALGSEKHVSSIYDTCVFEFASADIRTVLNHIQSEEQEHGKKIYDFMSANGMYA